MYFNLIYFLIYYSDNLSQVLISLLFLSLSLSFDVYIFVIFIIKSFETLNFYLFRSLIVFNIYLCWENYFQIIELAQGFDFLSKRNIDLNNQL